MVKSRKSGSDSDDDEGPSLDPDDILLTKEIDGRVNYLDELGRPLNFGSSEHVHALGVTATAALTNRNRRADYTVKIPSRANLDFQKWALQLGSFLFHARSVLDNMMWAAVTSKPLGTLTKQQEAQVYFPIAATEDEWNSFLGKAHAKVIRPEIVDRIKAVQPFMRPGEPASRALLYLHKLHRYDKHRVPLTLFLIADPQWPMMFDIRAASEGEYIESKIDWLTERAPIRNRLPLVRVVTSRAMLQPTPSTVPLALVADLDGDHYDLQDLLWDVHAAVYRVVDGVGWDSTLRADLWDDEIAFERERLAAFNRSMLDNTDEWVEKHGDGGSPFDELHAQLREMGIMPPAPPDEAPKTFNQKPRRLGNAQATASTPPDK